jgi:hypothetical protein
MVQATRQFFSLLTLALTTLSTGYAAPTARVTVRATARAPSDCAASIDQNVLLYARPTDAYSDSSSEYQLQLTRTPENYDGFTEYVMIVSRQSLPCLPMLTIIQVCPNGSCTSTPSSLDWYLKDGALTPHQSDRQTIDLPVKLDSKVKFRMLGVENSQETARDFCAVVSQNVLVMLSTAC